MAWFSDEGEQYPEANYEWREIPAPGDAAAGGPPAQIPGFPAFGLPVEIRARGMAPETPWTPARYYLAGWFSHPAGKMFHGADESYEWRYIMESAMDEPRTTSVPPEHEDPYAATKSPRRRILDEAADTVDGPRNESYGGPEDSFKVIASLWAAYLEAIQYGQRGDYELAPHDVALMMALLKAARLAGSNGGHRDSWVDLAGYAACGAECAGVV
jgi:hypothetical protein